MTQEDQYMVQRQEKVDELRQNGINPFPNDIRPVNTASEIHANFQDTSKEDLEKKQGDKFSVAGRIMAIRAFGKAAFIQIRDNSGEMQIFVQKQLLGDEQFNLYKKFDIGDFAYFNGYLFLTKTNELTLCAESLRIVNKTLRQLPEKWHGLTDIEARYRHRYVDMIANPTVKETFIKRSKIIKEIRQFFEDRGFLEVETPMMHPIPGGAAAKPFITHHNKLHRDLYLRIAPELYLKRLLVGGIEKVFEINRNFRNEGISIQHNPEFTMCEFYQSYATFEDLIKITEELLSTVAQKVSGTTKIT
ncbi:lysine--tRNA ligase, partial [bacterium]|nr:lysine--tRNA ligase [bacterium]